MKSVKTKAIVFITGAFVSNSIWDDWRTYFEMNGYVTIAPSWPYKDAPTQELRNRHPDTAIAAVDLRRLIEHFSSILKHLPEKAILIGHSAGGLLTQLLLQQDLAIAGIAINSVPPKGVLTFKFFFFRYIWGPLVFFTSKKGSFLMSFSQWQHVYTNGMSLSEQKAGYEKFVVPESKKLLRDMLTECAEIDFKKKHVPLLFVSGSNDHFIPASLNYSNYRNYEQNGSITDYKEFKGKTHFVLRQSDWQEEARYILNWIENQ